MQIEIYTAKGDVLDKFYRFSVDDTGILDNKIYERTEKIKINDSMTKLMKRSKPLTGQEVMRTIIDQVSENAVNKYGSVAGFSDFDWEIRKIVVEKLNLDPNGTYVIKWPVQQGS